MPELGSGRSRQRCLWTAIQPVAVSRSRKVFRRVVRLINVQTDRLSVLDVGCGTGFYLGQWQALGVKCLAGMDISDWAV